MDFSQGELDIMATALGLAIQENDWREGYDWEAYKELEQKVIDYRDKPSLPCSYLVGVCACDRREGCLARD